MKIEMQIPELSSIREKEGGKERKRERERKGTLLI
jgi:hypothetical protein